MPHDRSNGRTSEGASRLSGLRALRALFFRPAPVRPTTAWAARRLHRRRPDAPLLDQRRRASQHHLHGRRDHGARGLCCPDLATRSVLPVLTAALVATIVAAASVKRATMNMVVHAYDLFFYLSSWSTISYLWSDHRRYVLGLVGALLATAIAARIAYRADSTRVAAGGLPRRCSLHRWWPGTGRGEGRAPPHAVLLPEPVRLLVLCLMGRDAGNAMARRAAGGRAEGAARRRPSRFPPRATRTSSRRTSS